MTARTLETLIRLSTAHAKARLSTKVQERDAQAAEEILRFALYKQVLKRERRKRRKLNTGGATAANEDESDDEDEEGSDGEEEVAAPERMPDSPVKPPAKRKSVTPAPQNEDLPMDDPASTAVASDVSGVNPERHVKTLMVAKTKSVLIAIFSSRLKLFRKRLAALFSSTLQDTEQIELENLLPMINEGLSSVELFGTDEATNACQVMTDANELFISEGIVYKM